MVNSMVERATSDMLIGPDWAMNLEICDMLNHDPGQAKDVVKGIKKRIGSKNPKVQLLALTLLETIIKNCGDIVHMHVAERDVLHEMVKIMKKKPEFRVKEKILTLIDTWQEAFGGPRARYPQYYAAYQELLRAGAVFPQRSGSSAPVFTPPQTHPLSTYPPNIRNPELRQETAESSAEPDFPTLSLSEIQNARGIMDVLAEMLNAIDPSNKEGLQQEVIVDLVEQCRTYKQRVVHLVNSTSDESLLSQGLALNDDLQRLLAKHEAIASGNSVHTDKRNSEPTGSKSEPGPLVDNVGPLIDTGSSTKQTNGSPSPFDQLLLPAPPTANGTTQAATANSKIDLLSGDDFASPKAETSLALVPITAPQSSSPVASQQNALALIDMFSDSNPGPSNSASAPTVNSAAQTLPNGQMLQQPINQTLETGFQPNGLAPNMGYSHYEQPQYAQGGVGSPWNGQLTQQQPSSLSLGGETNGMALPPPPWEAQPQDSSPPAVENSYGPYPTQATQAVAQIQPINTGGYPQGPPQQAPGNQVVGMYVQVVPGGQLSPVNAQHPQSGSQYLGYQQPHQMQGGFYMGMQAGQVNPMYYPQNTLYATQMGGYGGYSGYNGYTQHQGTSYLEQQMHGMSLGANSGTSKSSNPVSESLYLPPMKPKNKPEDKLFGDLVDMSKFKQMKTTPGRAGSM